LETLIVLLSVANCKEVQQSSKQQALNNDTISAVQMIGGVAVLEGVEKQGRGGE